MDQRVWGLRVVVNVRPVEWRWRVPGVVEEREG